MAPLYVGSPHKGIVVGGGRVNVRKDTSGKRIVAKPTPYFGQNLGFEKEFTGRQNDKAKKTKCPATHFHENFVYSQANDPIG